MDGVVKLWDTNVLEVALEFDFKSKVRCHGLNNKARGDTWQCSGNRTIFVALGAVCIVTLLSGFISS